MSPKKTLYVSINILKTTLNILISELNIKLYGFF